MATSTQSRKLFGRKPDLDYLLKRAGDNGLTSIVARPQAGKTWLLRQFTDSLSSSSEYLVGYAESTGQYADLLRRSLQDLYTRWLSNSSYLEQARSLWTRHKNNLTTQFGRTVGSALGRVLEASTHAKGLSSSIDSYFNGLHQVNRDLQSGGITLPVLDYDQARDLLLLLDHLSGGEKRAVLILDAFEQGDGAEVEAGTLGKFLSHLDEWPECHMFLAMRVPEANEKETTALRCARELSQASVAAEIWHLPNLHLEGDLPECDVLLYYLRDKVPATRNVSDERLLAMIGGYAGVVGRWVKAQDVRAQAPQDEEDLRRLAEDANALRYRELETLLLNLQAENQAHFLFAVRLALLPELQSSAMFEFYRDVLVTGSQKSPVPSLQACGLLHIDDEDPDAPSYGHTARYESIRRLICAARKFMPHTRQQAEKLIIDLAARVTSVEPVTMPYGEALANLGAISQDIRLSEFHQGLCECARILLPGLDHEPSASLILQAAALARQHPQAAVLLALALLNTLSDAKREQDLSRRDASLDLLRTLAVAHPDNPGIQMPLAMGLLGTLNHAKEEQDLSRRDALLEELRALAASRPEDPRVEELLCKGLFNTLNDTQEEQDLSRRDALLSEIRALAATPREDPGVQEQLAKALFNTLNYAQEEQDLGRCDALLEELRTLAAALPENPGVQVPFARGLFNMRTRAKREQNLSWRDALLENLRTLGAAQPENPGVQEELAGGLFNTLNDAKGEGDFGRRDALLKEIRTLAAARPDNLPVQAVLAEALFNTLNDAKEEQDLGQRDALLEELRTLSAAHLEHPGVQEMLAGGLSNTLAHAKEEQDLGRGGALLEELRTLAVAHPENAGVQEPLAIGLRNGFQNAIQEEDVGLANALLYELRGLMPKLTDSPNVRRLRTFLDKFDVK